MAVDFVSLAIIAVVAAAVPFVAKIFPGNLIPETVFLLFIGAVIGPHMMQLIQTDTTISFLSDLGLAFLFLLAGYEIDPKHLGGKLGAHALGTWLVSLGVALVVVIALGLFEQSWLEGCAVAIAMTSTALGTLMPIMKERGLMGTRMGNTIIAYGTWGELGPIIAMALMLSARSAWLSLAVLAILALICVLIVVFNKVVSKYATRLHDFLEQGDQTTSQTYVRLAMLLLVALLAFSAVFDLDLVLGAFAAGFVLRFLVPDNAETLETKLIGMGHGFFIPLFFVCSGAKIDLAALTLQPVMLAGFILLLMVVRFLPMIVDMRFCPATRDMERGNRVGVAFYCTTALPIIVAVTTVATNAGAMEESTASVLVAAGAITVFFMPLLAIVAQFAASFRIGDAIAEVRGKKATARQTVHDHAELARIMVIEHRVEEQERMLAALQSRRSAAGDRLKHREEVLKDLIREERKREHKYADDRFIRESYERDRESSLEDFAPDDDQARSDGA